MDRAPAIPGAAVVTSIGRGLDSLQSTDQVRYFSFDTGEERESLAVGQELAVGDEVVALADDLFVEVTCAAGSQIHVAGDFRLQINLPASGQDCAIDTRGGGLDVLTDTEVETCSAGVCAATPGTRYALTVDRSAGRPEPEILVFDGTVAVTAGDRRAEVTSRRSLRVLQPGDPGSAVDFESAEVPPAKLEWWAEVYARYDVVNARAAGVELSGATLEQARADFTRLYTQVLADPEATAPRAELATLQVDYKVDRAALYNAKRAGMVTQEQVDEHQIDAGRLRPTNEVDRRKLEVLIRTQGADGGARALGTTPATTRVATPLIREQATVGPSVSGRLMASQEVVDLGPPADASAEQRAAYWQRQVALYEAAAERGELDARKMLAGARAFAEQGDRRRATALARRALTLNQSTSLLSARELGYANRLAGGY